MKNDGPPVRLEILTDDERLAALTRAYWEVDKENFFVTSAKEIGKQYRALGYRGDMNSTLRQAARAVVEDVHCCSCGAEIVARDRSSLSGLIYRSNVSCAACQKKHAEEIRNAAEKEGKDGTERLRIAVEEYTAQADIQEYWVDYSTLSFEMCMKLSAYDAWSGHALTNEGGAPCRAGLITPTYSGSLDALNLFHKSWLIRPALDPVRGTHGFKLEEGRFTWTWNQVRTILVPHVTGSRNDAIAIASVRLPDAAKEGVQVWRECATEACLAYLDTQMEKNCFPLLDEDDRKETKRSLVVSLEHYSVAQVRSIVWKCVRDAAALCARPYYSLTKAKETIPGKIERSIQAARASQRDVPAYYRTEENPISELEILFRNRFGISEMTVPTEVDAIFERVMSENRRTVGAIEEMTGGKFSPVELDVALKKILPADVYAYAEDEVEAMKLVAFSDFLELTTDELRGDVETVRRFARRWWRKESLDD